MGDSIGKGYVSIHRELMDHWLWKEKPFTKGQAWIDLILLANYKTEKFAYKGAVIDGKRGTVYRSVSYLADRWGWGREKTKRFLDLLHEDGMVELMVTTHQTTVTLINYDRFQNPPSADNTTNRQQAGSRPSANRQAIDTYNKGNNENNSNQLNNGVDEVSGQSPEEIEEAQRWFESLQEE